jgi:PAS domain S-box-containing protein
VQQSAKLATFTAFYCLAVNTPISSFSTHLTILFRFLHEISFPFSVAIPGSKVFPLPFMEVIRNLWTYNAIKDVQQWTAYLVGSLVLCNFGYLVYLVHFYLTRRGTLKPHPTIVKVFQGHIYYSCGPLAIPYVSMMLNYISCEPNAANCNIIEVSGGEAALFFILSLLHCIYFIVYEASIYNWSPVGQSPAAKAHHRVTVISACCRSVCVITFGILDSQRSLDMEYGLIIFCLFYHAINTVSYWYEYPFYSMWMNYIHTSTYAISFMASLSMLLGLVSTGAGDLVCVGLFFVGTILLLPTIYSLLRWRVTTVDNQAVGNLKTDTQVELKVRILMNKISAAQENESDAFDSELCDQIEEVIQIHFKNFKSSFKFNLIWATYLFHFKQNKFSSMTKLRLIINNSPFIFDIFPLQIRLRCVSGYIGSEDSEEGLATYEEQVRLERLSIESMSKSLSAQLRFWGTLASEDYTLEKLERITMDISNHTESSRTSLQRIVALNPKSPFYRRLYSQFLLNIANDDSGAKRQLTRAMELESEEEGNYNLTDSSNCIMIISGERETLGEILEANNRTCEVFGVSSEDIIGRKINLLMAKPYALAHNAKLINYIEKKLTNLSTLNRTVVMKGSNGLAFEGQLQIREYSNFTLDPSIAFFGAIQPLKNRIFSVVKISDLLIWEVSAKFSTHFNLDISVLKNHDCQIEDVLPGFDSYVEEINKALETNETYRFVMSMKNNKIESELNLCVYYLPYIQREYYMVVVEMETEDPNNHMRASDNVSTSKLDIFNSMSKSKAEKKMVIVAGDSSDDSDSDESQSESNGEHESKSQASSNSKSSRSTNLLRMGLVRTGVHFEPKLKTLFTWIVLLLTTLCAMGITVQLLWSSLTINRYQASLNLLTIPLRSGTTIGSYSAQMFDHIFRGNFFETEEDALREEQRLRRILTDMTDKLGLLKTIIFDSGKSLTAQEIDTILGVHFNLTDYEGKPKTLDFIEAVHLYTVAFTIILNKNMTDLRSDQRTLDFLKSNTVTDIPRVWNQSCMNILEIQTLSAERVQMIEFGFMVAALTLVAFIFVTVFMPSIYYVLKQKAEVYIMFESMEMGNLRDIIGQCGTKLCEIDGVEQTANNMEIQDMMEVISSKTKSSSSAAGTGKGGANEKEPAKTSKLVISFSRVIMNHVTYLLFVILLLTALYFAGYYVWWTQARSSLFNDIDKRVYNSRNRNWFVQKLTQSVIGWDYEENAIKINLTETELWERKIWEVDHALYYGDHNLGILTDIRIISGGEAMLGGNICNQFYEKGILAKLYNKTACETYYDGVMTRGAHELYIAFLSLSEDLRRTYVTKGIDAALPRIHALKEMSDFWIPHVGSMFDTWLSTVFEDGFKSASFTRSIGTVFYVVVCILMAGFVYYPTVRKLNTEIQRTRNMLTIIPNEIVENSSSLREQVRAIALRMIQS